jgi:dodecin
MAGKSTYKIVEMVGTSKISWAEAAKIAVKTAGKSLADLRIAEVVKLDMVVEDGKVSKYRARIKVSFKYHGEKVISESYKKAKILS